MLIVIVNAIDHLRKRAVGLTSRYTSYKIKGPRQSLYYQKKKKRKNKQKQTNKEQHHFQFINPFTFPLRWII